MKKNFILLLTLISIILLGCTNNQNDDETSLSYNNLFNDGLLGICTIENECGYLNEDFEIEIPLEYSFVGRFNHGIAMVGHYNDCGVINTSNEVIIPLEYETASFNYEHELIKLLNDGMYYYFDFEGNELTYREAHIKQGFSEDTLFIYSVRYRYTTSPDYETAYGYKNIDGDVVIEASFDNVHEYYFSESTIVKDGRYYVILSDSGDTSNYFCERISHSFFDGYVSIQANDQRWGISENTGHITLEAAYKDPITLNNNGYGIVETVDELFGIVTYDGDFIVKPTYNVYGGSFKANKYHDKGFIILYDESAYYLYNDFAELIYTSEDIIYDKFHDYIILRDKETYKYSMINLKGEEILSGFDSFDYSRDQNYILIREAAQNTLYNTTIYDKDINLVNEFDFLPSFEYVDNRSDDAFLSIQNYDNEQLFLYNSDNELIKTFSRESIRVGTDVIIYDDGYITYYQPNLTLVILNHAGDEVYNASNPKYKIQYEYSYFWTH